MQTVTPQRQPGYRGRVRSGCLTCRGRKVKCDELRPICNNCTRLKRPCVYKPRRNRHAAVAPPSLENVTPDERAHIPGSSRSPGTASVTEDVSPPRFEEQNSVVTGTFQLDGTVSFSWGPEQDPFQSPDSSIVDVTARLEKALRRRHETSATNDERELDETSPSTLISRDIELTTTMDILAAREFPLQPLFSFFVAAVDCPCITPYDAVNWQRIKLTMVDLASSHTAVASAIIALSALYKGQMFQLPLSKALSLYHSSRNAYSQLLNERPVDVDVMLVVTFLLCLFEFVHYEAAPTLKDPSEIFITRFGTWARHDTSQSELSVRIVIWLRLLHATTIRGGGMGLVPDRICSLFPNFQSGTHSLRSPAHRDSDDISTHLYGLLSAPMFEFYVQLQIISADIARSTHYHRSRTTGVDQEEVVDRMTHIKSRLHALWESRSATQRQTPEDLRAHLAPKVADPLITLVGLCAAAYHAEFVEIHRVLGDPVSESTDSKQAMRQIREIVDGDWNVYDGDGGKLNSGYIRPLFLYAIECMDRDENQWAVQRLEQVKDPICRSAFFASFGKALCEAQLRKERRVTSKYFCIYNFGVSPPFL